MNYCKEVVAVETYSVRHAVLRQGKPLETCAFDGDNLSSTKHFCCFDSVAAIGVISVFDNKTSIFPSYKQFQLRGMAVLESHQKQGIGNNLILFAEKYIKSQNGEIIWFNAREVAVPFYEKMGYQIRGNPFKIQDIGQHFVMFKSLEVKY